MIDSKTIQFLRFFFMSYPWRSAGAVALLGLAGLLEGVGIVSLIPILQAAEGGSSQPTDIGAFLVAGLNRVGLEATLGVLLTLLFLAILAKAAVVWVAMTQVRSAVIWVGRELRLRLLRALLRARIGLFGKEKSGEWANAVTQEVLASGAAYREACEIIAAIFPIMAYISIATFISWQTSLFAVASGAMLIGGLRGFVAVGRRAGADMADLRRNLAGLTVDVIGGLKPIKAMGREHFVEPLFEKSILELDGANRRAMYANEHTRFFQEPALTLLLALGIYFLFEFRGLPLATIVVLAFMFYRILSHLNTLQMRYQILVVGEASFWSLMSRMDEAERSHERLHGGGEPGPLSEEIRFDGVSFSYEGVPVLNCLDLRVEAGSFVSIEGGSGSGKTTLIDLLVGLLGPDSGRLLIDGVDIDELDLKAWRRQIGYVPQEMLLLNDSIRHNVSLGDPSVSDEEIEVALRLAGAWGFVTENREGLDTAVGERGSKLSGGQRQRVAIARALVKKPSVLILDEVTTALDPATEAAICQTLAELRGQITIVSISHQLAMRAVADEAWGMNDGVVTRLTDQPTGAPTSLT